MMNIPNKQIKRRGLSLLLSIILVFCMFGAIIFSVSRKTAREMSNSAIQNLSESLDLIQSTIEAILRSGVSDPDRPGDRPCGRPGGVHPRL